MNFFLPTIFLCVYLLSFSAEVSNNLFVYKTVKQPACDSTPRRNLHYNIITNAYGYGYNIYANERLLVHQPSVPGICGTKGFGRKVDARKVAELVIKKISQGLMPPTISQKELDSLQIKY
jgi:hypothetical protein